MLRAVFVELVGDGPTYLRLYRGLRDAILSSRLPAGAALPSTRQLAQELALSRNTVLRAYEQLIAEGFASARHGGGTFVAEHVVERTPLATGPLAGRINRAAGEPRGIDLSAGGARIAAAVAKSPFAAIGRLPPVPYDFLFGVPDAGLFPIQEWRKAVSRCIDRASRRTLGYDHPAGVPRLRELVAAHIVKRRGVRCRPEQIVIASGAQQALDLLARLLVEPDSAVLVEDPCYPAVRAILEAAGARITVAPVDEEGILLDAVDGALAGGCRLAYVTPSHQFPTGAVMSAPRRQRLLEWAARVGAVVVEDDYDGDYRHRGQPIQAMQGMDVHERVVHVGTFSKSLFPALRLAYVVAPPSLAEPLAAAKWVSDWSSSALIQHALADFIEGGHFARHLKRSAAVYARRRDALCAAIGREIGGDAVVSGGDAGMHVVLWLPSLSCDQLLAAVPRARALGVGVYPVAAFYQGPCDRAGLVLGYSGLSEEQIGEGIALLARALAT